SAEHRSPPPWLLSGAAKRRPSGREATVVAPWASAVPAPSLTQLVPPSDETKTPPEGVPSAPARRRARYRFPDASSARACTSAGVGINTRGSAGKVGANAKLRAVLGGAGARSSGVTTRLSSW